MLEFLGAVSNAIFTAFSWATVIAAGIGFFFLIRHKKIFGSVLTSGYILFFLITQIFFAEWHRAFFGTVLLFFALISIIFSNYEDKKNGRRWWDW